MVKLVELQKRFLDDLDKIATDLIHAYRLEFKQEVEHLANPLYRWMDFRLRYIDPRPKQVVLSNKFPKYLPEEVNIGLDTLEKMIIQGEDINGYQSKGLIQFNDFSAKRSSKRTDLLWADWGITHLHITDIPIPEDQFFSDRTCSSGESWLLFCLIVGETVGFIDVRRHNDADLFSDKDLILTVKQSWPEYMEIFKLKGILPAKEDLDNKQIADLRRNGLNPPICIDGEVFMGPGMGIVTSNTPMLVTDRVDRIHEWGQSLAEWVLYPETSILQKLKTMHVSEPELSLCLTPKGIAIYEGQADIAFLVKDGGYSEFIESLICPSWALKFMSKQADTDSI